MSAIAVSTLLKKFQERDRAALAKAITLIESTVDSDRKNAETFLENLSPKKETIRIAISGPPGVGKSTFINALGQQLLTKNLSIAILPIDPSSDENMGSVLADKTRMKELLLDERVYIRPSPSKGSLGGVAMATSDAIFVVEAFGFDVVIIETTGVGQSETVAKTLADHFIVLLQPGSGDELQAMKKGILEKADFILVNKADGEQKELAQKTKSAQKALTITKKSGEKKPAIFAISSLFNEGIDTFLTELLSRHHALKTSGELKTNRNRQREHIFDFYFREHLSRQLETIPFIKNRRQEILDQCSQKNMTMSFALESLAKDICRKLMN